MSVNKRYTYTLDTAQRIAKRVNDQVQYVEEQAKPYAIKYAMDAVMGKGRTRTIRYIATRSKVPQWIVRKRLNRRWQRKANVKDWNKFGAMTAKSQMLTHDISAIGLLGTSKQPPSPSKLKGIQKARRGVKAGKHYFPQGFVADGSRRVSDKRYNAYLEKVYGTRPFLKGKQWLVMERIGKKAYPIDSAGIPIQEFAGRALDSFTRRIYRQEYTRTYEAKLLFAMSRVK